LTIWPVWTFLKKDKYVALAGITTPECPAGKLCKTILLQIIPPRIMMESTPVNFITYFVIELH
jgi:hypothetical protein